MYKRENGLNTKKQIYKMAMGSTYVQLEDS